LTRYIANQFIRVIATLLAVCFLINLLLNFMPGDPAAIVAGDAATPKQIEMIRGELRLDRSLVSRYVAWVSDSLRGDLGRSLVNKPGASVTGLIVERLPVTFQLTGLALLIAVLIAIPAGVGAAMKWGTWLDQAITAAGSFVIAIPGFVIGLLLVDFFAVQHSIFPSAGFTSLSDDPREWFMHLVLPALALAAVPAAEIARQTRGAMIDVFEESYIRTAKACGFPRWKIILKYAGKAAIAPILTVFGLQAAFLLSGAIVIEQVFVLPGLGSLAFDAVQIRDVPVVQGIVLTGATIVLVVNMVVDLALFYLVPKSR